MSWSMLDCGVQQCITDRATAKRDGSNSLPYEASARIAQRTRALYPVSYMLRIRLLSRYDRTVTLMAYLAPPTSSPRAPSRVEIATKSARLYDSNRRFSYTITKCNTEESKGVTEIRTSIIGRRLNGCASASALAEAFSPLAPPARLSRPPLGRPTRGPQADAQSKASGWPVLYRKQSFESGCACLCRRCEGKAPHARAPPCVVIRWNSARER
jgi:hypothetical protein